MFRGGGFGNKQTSTEKIAQDLIQTILRTVRIPYRIPNLPLLVGLAESGMVEKMRAEAAR